MGLFSSKKNPCAICGGATPRIFARMIEDRPLCSDCSGRIDMEPCLQDDLTLQSVKEHFVFLDENKALRNRFVISKKFDFGLIFGQKIIIDVESKLFCMSGAPDKMIFSGSHIKSFTIREDNEPLFEGSPAGLKRYTSKVPERLAALAPQIALLKMSEQVSNQLDRNGENKDTYRPSIDLPEPFEDFYVEIKLDHPYWRTIQFKVGGPDLSNTHPDLNNYLLQYDQTAAKLEELAFYLKDIAFPGVEEKFAGQTTSSQPAMTTATSVDSIGEIRRFKGLLEEGLITEEEYAAKKKQLLGI